MKDIILDRLSRMEDLEQRKMLKQIVSGALLNLMEYQEEMNRQLEERVFNEMEDWGDKYDIYVSLAAREDVDPIHEYLHPMVAADMDKQICNMTELLTALNRGEDAYLLTLFLECDFVLLKSLLQQERTFTGTIVTARGSHTVGVQLKQNATYMQEIERLYRIFQVNNVPWRTVNHPYAYKFFDVYLVTYEEGMFREGEEIFEISVHLEEYEVYKRLNLVPLWNIERLTMRTVGFPVPAKDRVSYEHVMNLHATGVGHGYLIDGDEADIRYTKRGYEDLIIVTPQSKSMLWNVLKIIQPVTSKLGHPMYDRQSNKRVSSFIDRFARRQAIVVRAKAEIVRLIQTFEVSKGLELEEITIMERSDEREQTYNMNPFISDHVRVERDKKIMRMKFRLHHTNNFTTSDVLSFIVSEVQMYFPEYKCEGEWT
ncbi:normocyte-binding protein [Paenibacillus arenosi]|uniref:Normocyte-binding protein n=1 Tax=Paenibacillus arenosi TaxID=2774142 RepID=A0ABR9AXE0_9BACL|nr:normocyte-binding protein [Paenibacillus arenosi]MBD8498804.1 normocyte-binding protein [Paenibacillus arenosi]